MALAIILTVVALVFLVLAKADYTDRLYIEFFWKAIAAIAVSFMALVSWGAIGAKEEQERCNTQSLCNDDTARIKSFDTRDIVKSNSGKIYFFGFVCTIDCGGHKAGFYWAEKQVSIKNNRLENADDCTGNSYSFISGCRTYMNHLSQDTEDPRESKGCYSRDC
jgi:hypothetical protein